MAGISLITKGMICVGERIVNMVLPITLSIENRKRTLDISKREKSITVSTENVKINLRSIKAEISITNKRKIALICVKKTRCS